MTELGTDAVVKEKSEAAKITEESYTEEGTHYGAYADYETYEDPAPSPDTTSRVIISSSAEHGTGAGVELGMTLDGEISLGTGADLEKKILTKDGHTSVTITHNITRVSTALSCATAHII